MTVDIVFCLHDGAVLMADDHRSKPFKPNKPPEDNIDKIHKIVNSFAVVSFGIENVTEPALRLIDPLKIDNASSPNDVLNHIRDCVLYSWERFLRYLSEDVDTSNESMKAGFLMGGYIPRSENFVGGFLSGTSITESNEIKTEHRAFIVIGGEKQQASRFFKSKVLLNLPEHPIGMQVCNNIVMKVLEAGQQTITHVASTNDQVGTRLRYAVLRRGYSYYEKWY